jgi:hypothetical protein
MDFLLLRKVTRHANGPDGHIRSGIGSSGSGEDFHAESIAGIERRRPARDRARM